MKPRYIALRQYQLRREKDAIEGKIWELELRREEIRKELEALEMLDLEMLEESQTET